MQLDKALLEKGRRQYDATLNEENRALRDPIVTPFGMAMKIGGYIGILTKGDCLTFRACPICPVGKSSYSTLYEKDGIRVWACPLCLNITQD